MHTPVVAKSILHPLGEGVSRQSTGTTITVRKDFAVPLHVIDHLVEQGVRAKPRARHVIIEADLHQRFLRRVEDGAYGVAVHDQILDNGVAGPSAKLHAGTYVGEGVAREVRSGHGHARVPLRIDSTADGMCVTAVSHRFT